MSDNTHIEWTDATWNPVWGCTAVSPGCDHCYAETLVNGRLAHLHPGGFGVVRLRPEQLDKPLRWRRPRRIFVNSMSDLFHQDVPDEFIARVFAVMALAPQHTFQVLTKRHGRMRSLLASEAFRHTLAVAASDQVGEPPFEPCPTFHRVFETWPLPNVWLGVSVENQHWADIRIPALLQTPAAVRFISVEPLLGPVKLTRLHAHCPTHDFPGGFCTGPCGDVIIPDWVIAGGESGPGARPMHPDWARSLRDQCAAAGVAFLFKQRGEWTWNEPGQFAIPSKPYSDRVAVMHGAGMVAMTKSNPFNPFEVGHPYWTTRIERVGKKAAGRELDGVVHDGYPAAVHA